MILHRQNKSKRLKAKSGFWLRLTNWEYWPSWLTNIPVVGFWLFQAAKTGKLFFFSTVNPGAKTGGLLGNSKMDILRAIPEQYIPKSELFKQTPYRKEQVLSYIAENDLSFPLIMKPDIGERGLKVERLDNLEDLNIYLKNAPYDIILQEYVSLPMEVTLLCYRMPDSQESGITSACVKEFLSVTGDGKSNLGQLIEANERAALYLDTLGERWQKQWTDIPDHGETIWLQPIGNHCKGTKFINANDRIDEALIATFSQILRQMKGFYYGRFDMRCHTWEELKEGKNFKILEFNGVNSEPAHIYDPNYSTANRYRDFYKQWSLMARIHRAQSSLGIQPLSFRDAWQEASTYLRYLKIVKSS